MWLSGDCIGGLKWIVDDVLQVGATVWDEICSYREIELVALMRWKFGQEVKEEQQSEEVGGDDWEKVVRTRP